jgi:hypothetical protein
MWLGPLKVIFINNSIKGDSPIQQKVALDSSAPLAIAPSTSTKQSEVMIPSIHISRPTPAGVNPRIAYGQPNRRRDRRG